MAANYAGIMHKYDSKILQNHVENSPHEDKDTWGNDESNKHKYIKVHKHPTEKMTGRQMYRETRRKRYAQTG